MNRLFLFLASILMALNATGQTRKAIDFEALFNRLDTEINLWHGRIAAHRQKLDSLKALYLHASDPRRSYDLCSQIVEGYKAFQNDSAIAYAAQLAQIAPWTADQSLVGISKLKLAYQATKSGYYDAAAGYLAETDTAALGEEGKTEYFRVSNNLYRELAAYCYIWTKRQEYIDEQTRCRRELMHRLPKGSGEWLMHKAFDEMVCQRFEEARHYSDLCLHKVPRYSPLYRQAAFDRRFICESLHQEDSACYWLAECAIAEMRLGWTDQVGLWSLASKMGDRDLGRSYNYIRFSWNAVEMYGHSMRSWQITPVMSAIEHRYQEEIARYDNILQLGIIVVSVLLMVTVALLVHVNGQRRRLHAFNRQLHEANSKLSDTSRAKEEYITQLLAYSSDFIDQKEEERRSQSKLLRMGKEAELARQLNSADKPGKELGRLLARFDEIFLGLYPTFVEEFNALLVADKQLHPSRPGQMNTPLRIFALMRLGIEKVPDVARILHCSAQTVYNYRNNLRNACRYEREEFESRVKRIAMPDLVR